MNVELFAPCSVEHGDHKVRGQMIVCGKCGGVARVPLTARIGGGNDDRQIELLAMRRFSKMGWIIGKTTTRHRCPSCQTEAKPFAALVQVLSNNSKEDSVVIQNTTMSKERQDKGLVKFVADTGMESTSRRAVINASTAVRSMSRDDRRVIFAKLNDVYLTERTGYGGGWTDAKVAADLGVPVDWVKDVREDNFGPDTNVAAAEQIATSHEVIAKVKDFLTKLDALNKEAAPMRELLEKTQADVAALTATMAA